MSVLLVEELVRLGVRRSHIAIEQNVGGDELDCVAVVGGELDQPPVGRARNSSGHPQARFGAPRRASPLVMLFAAVATAGGGAS